MVEILIIMLVSALSTSSMEAQETSYLPTLRDGRVWNYMEIYRNTAGQNDTIWKSCQIKGNEFVDGHVGYRLCIDDVVIWYLYEEGPKVFFHDSSGWHLLYDYSLSVGDYVMGGMRVEVSEKVSVRNTERRRLTFGIVFGSIYNSEYCWLEGIGPNHLVFYPMDAAVPFSLVDNQLVSVYDAEECIYDYTDTLISGIVTVT